MKTCRCVWAQCSHKVAHHHRLYWQCLPVLHVAQAQQPLHASCADVSVRICTRYTVGHAQRLLVMQGSSNQEPGLSSASSSKTHTQELPSQVARPPRVRRKAAKKALAEQFSDGIREADSQDTRSTGRRSAHSQVTQQQSTTCAFVVFKSGAEQGLLAKKECTLHIDNGINNSSLRKNQSPRHSICNTLQHDFMQTAMCPWPKSSESLCLVLVSHLY